jgi:hypothetical protein
MQKLSKTCRSPKLRSGNVGFAGAKIDSTGERRNSASMDPREATAITNIVAPLGTAIKIHSKAGWDVILSRRTSSASKE